MSKSTLLSNIKNGKILPKYPSIRKQFPNLVEDIQNTFGLTNSQKLFNYLNNINDNPICKFNECNNEVNFFSFSYGYKKYCSKECEKKSISNIKKSYTKEENKIINNKRIKTCINKYGVENVAQNKDVYDKIIKTNNINLGVDYPMQNKNVLNKREQNNIDKWGVKYLTQLEEHVDIIKKKRKKTIYKKLIEKYTKLGINIKSYNEKDKELIGICSKCSKEYSAPVYIIWQRFKADLNICTKCDPIGCKSSSQFEKNVLLFIKKYYKGKIITNDKKILKGKELDIYLPDLNLAFECNGTYWHNELYKEKEYHRNKYLNSKKENIKLIQIWQDDWKFKKEIVQSRISNLLNNSRKIYARKCEIRIVNFKNSKDFLNNNHLQGWVPSKVNYGLYFKGELVSILNFSKKRISISNNDTWELLRFCNKLNYTIVGGASKLFKRFINEHSPDNVISYANLEWGEGLFYNNLGFSRLKDTNIGYSYIYKEKKFHRYTFRKDVLVKDGYDSKMTEHEIMLSRNIYRVYNSGNALWKWTK